VKWFDVAWNIAGRGVSIGANGAPVFGPFTLEASMTKGLSEQLAELSARAKKARD
jgi:hypothetical protein